MRMTPLRRAIVAATGMPIETWEVVKLPAPNTPSSFAIVVKGERVAHGHQHLVDAINQAVERLADRAHAAWMIEASGLVFA